MPLPSPDSQDRATGHALGAAANPALRARPVTDAGVLRQHANFAELRRQRRPIVSRGATSNATQFFAEGTTRRSGLRPETIDAYAHGATPPDAFFSGMHPKGKAGEVLAAREVKQALLGRPTHCTNAPAPTPRVSDVRLNPDPTAIRDLILEIRTDSGTVLQPGPQVKNGTPSYIARRAVEDATKPGYARDYVIDGRLVNPDGTPRVAPGAFTEMQAQQIQDAGIRLTGIDGLEAYSDYLLQDASAWQADGLTPKARAALSDLRTRLAQAYRPEAVAGRALGAGATAIAASVLASVVHQIVTGGSVDVEVAFEGALPAGVIGAGSVAADAAAYHVFTRGLGLAPEAAQAAAAHVVATSLCLVAVAADVTAELSGAQQGERSCLDAAAGVAWKSTLNLLPLTLTPLGLGAIPVVLAAQIGGRRCIDHVRALDREAAATAERSLLAAHNDHADAESLHVRMDRLEALIHTRRRTTSTA